MPNYRRAWLKGGCWFFTVNLHDRRLPLLIEEIDLLREAVRVVRARSPFQIDAIVVLPDHIHTVWTLPDGDANFSSRWRAIKKHFTKALPHIEYCDPTRRSRRERGIWQRRYWEHLIRTEDDFARHIHYCYINPVKHGLVSRVQDWPYSSFHRDVKLGLFPLDWAGDSAAPGDYGEPNELSRP
ncbi:REP-associated tyrosine transposase [Rhodopseudomonas palustris]|uniref:Transposase n=1 Tax=Rhodopseudomonas palustris TaxID=1076 RepID=A0A418V3T5_RHOPL|nr:transposase [Rhodopseudomonas palustris]RJF70755.1 transposase [Rhodopseudomonas palustris]